MEITQELAYSTVALGAMLKTSPQNWFNDRQSQSNVSVSLEQLQKLFALSMVSLWAHTFLKIGHFFSIRPFIEHYRVKHRWRCHRRQSVDLGVGRSISLITNHHLSTRYQSAIIPSRFDLSTQERNRISAADNRHFREISPFLLLKNCFYAAIWRLTAELKCSSILGQS